MSVHEEGYGGNAAPTLEFESDSEFASRPSNGSAPGDQSWGMNARSAQKSGGPLMNSGAGRPGQPMMGQRSIFGTGRGPVFAQVPAYTPVTRAPDPREQQVQPAQPDFGVYVRQNGAVNPPGVSGYSNGAPQAYPSPSNDRGAAHDYSTPAYPSSTHPAQSYEPQPRPQTQPNPTYSPQSHPPQPQPSPHYSTPSYAPPVQPQPNRAAPSQANPAQPALNGGHPAQAYQPQANPARAYQDSGFPNRIFPEPTSRSSGPADQGFSGGAFADANFADASFPDASFPETSFADASFPGETHVEGGFSAKAAYAGSYGEPESLHLEAPADAFDTEPGYDPHAEQAMHEYVAHTSQADAYAGQGRPIPAHQALQTFEAVYDQPPQIPLGSTAHVHGSTQSFYDGEHVDADFLDEGQFAPGAEGVQPLPARKAGLRGRSMFMVGSALLGAVAFGGALAFAYKQSGGAMSEGAQPPLVQADNRPVKEPPEQPGGKDFPHKNKLIYERLQNGDQPEADHIVPRQEDLTMPNMPGANPAAGLPAGAALVPPPAVATVDDPSGGPRRVKTLTVRPDGSVMPPAADAAPPAAQPAMPPAAPQQVASAELIQPPAAPPQAAPAPAPAPAPVAAAPAPAAAPVAADPQAVAAIPAAKPKPKPVVAAADASPQAAASKYLVQIGSKQNQTEALATFADMQQKYPTLLANYRPMVQKADLGAKGVWYRLRIGPINDKATASKLCTQLKSQGMPDCLVMAAQ
jgi:cell division septation protein DedD